MKKLTAIVAAFMMLLSATAFATVDDSVPAKVKAAFVKDFAGSTDVTWEKTGDLYAAQFTLNGGQVKAVYGEGGELNSASRTISFKQLPLALIMSISQKYEGYTIAENATEVNTEGITSYYISVENDKQTILLRGLASGDLGVESKTKK